MVKNNDVEVKGNLRSLNRIPESHLIRSDLVALTIKSQDGRDVVVDFPLMVKSSFGIIPYQVALVGSEVKYSKRSSNTPDDVPESIFGANYELEFLSGPLKGNVYKEPQIL